MKNNTKTVFLFGMPRSGTTWIGKIFDSDPETLYMHEPDSWERMGFLPLFVDAEINESEKNQIESYHAALPAMRTSQVTSKLPVFRKNYQTIRMFNQYKASIYIVSMLKKMGFGSKLEPSARIGKDRFPSTIVWKSIESLGRLSCLCSTINNSFGIHIVRNPAGYIASVLSGEKMHNFRDISIPTSEDYPLFDMLLSTQTGSALGINIDDLKSMEPIERLAIRWRLYNEVAYELCKGMENYHLVRYEDVCRNPLDMTKELLSFCGMSCGEQTEKFVTKSTIQQNDAYYAVYKNPLKAAYRWREKLNDADIEKIQTILNGSFAFGWYQDDFGGSRT